MSAAVKSRATGTQSSKGVRMKETNNDITVVMGHLASKHGEPRPLQVCRSANGFYLGTLDDGIPNTHESQEYWETRQEAETALSNGMWTQRQWL
jgi:hypothetical protein